MSLTTPDKIRTFQRKLYCKAKAEPAFRFYVLYDKICREDILHHAYRLARANAGAPGVDEVTFAQIEERGLEAWLAGLREELVSKTYRPDPVRRVMIPKPNGEGERALGIPTIRDRVIQTAAKLVLEPIFEADFEGSAYGYRPARGAVDAVKDVHRHLCRGYTDVVDADLSRYFDSIPHDDLLKSVARRVADGAVLRLIKLWLKAPIEERDGDGRRRIVGGKRNKRGTPQGGVASPLLANIYMNRFLKHWRLTGRGEAFRAHVVSYRLRHPQPRLCGGGPGVDEGGDDQARADAQRGQDLAEGRPSGALHVPWLLVRSALVQGEWPMVPGHKPVQEERATAQDDSGQPAGARQQRPMAGSARHAKQISARLVELLLLRDAPVSIPQC
ncbi:MAG TPA: reverse transcriptase domain-containing protein [Candidatus Dormibacteraeota bacterium]